MTGKQTLVGAGGAALVLVNYWVSPSRQTVSAGLFGTGSTSDAHRSLATLGGELLFVVVATMLAGLSDGFGSVMVAVIVALFVLFAINYYGGGVTASRSPAATSGTVKGATS